jgi:hypothetical protein
VTGKKAVITIGSAEKWETNTEKLTTARATTNMGRTKDYRRTVHNHTRWMTIAQVELRVSREHPNLEPFTEDERIRFTEVMLDEAFTLKSSSRAATNGTLASSFGFPTARTKPSRSISSRSPC